MFELYDSTYVLIHTAMRSQLLSQLRATGFVRARGGNDIRDLNTNSENWSVVKVCKKMFAKRGHVKKGDHIIRQKLFESWIRIL